MSFLAATHSGNLVFDQLPNDTVRLCVEFLKLEKGSLSIESEDDRSIVLTSLICRNWQNNPIFEEERLEAYQRFYQRAYLKKVNQEIQLLKEYPSQLVRIFRNNHLSISQLPVLNLGNRMGEENSIDFIQVEEMPHPIMRFKDHYGRAGIALKIQAHKGIILRAQLKNLALSLREDLKQKKMSRIFFYPRIMIKIVEEFFKSTGYHAVLAYFKRYRNPELKKWFYSWGKRDRKIQVLYTTRHDKTDHVGPAVAPCLKCPFGDSDINETVFSSLLSGQDQDFSLPGHHATRLKNYRRGKNTVSLQKTILFTALAALAMAYLVNFYFASKSRE